MKNEFSDSIIGSVINIDYDANSLHELVKKREFEAIKQALDIVPLDYLDEYLNASDGDNEITALHGAVGLGYLEIVKILVEYKANINKQTAAGWNALHFAVAALSTTLYSTKDSTANKEILNFLLEKNGDVNAETCGFSPLTLAVDSSIQVDTIKLILLEGNVADAIKNDALNKAAEFGKIAHVRLLLEYNANPNKVNYNINMFFHQSVDETVKYEVIKLINKFSRFSNFIDKASGNNDPVLSLQKAILVEDSKEENLYCSKAPFLQKLLQVLKENKYDLPWVKEILNELEIDQIRFDVLHDKSLHKFINVPVNVLLYFEEKGFYSLHPAERIKKLAANIEYSHEYDRTTCEKTTEDLIWKLVRGEEQFEI